MITTSDGGYFITWSSLTEAGKIYGRHIGPDGLPTGSSAIVITEGEFSATLSPQVAVQNDGTVLITFEGMSLDGSSLEAVNVQALVDAMSAFAPTDITSNNVEEHEDYNSLQTTLAASWG